MSIRDPVASPRVIRLTTIFALIILTLIALFFLSRILAADYTGIV